MTRIVIKPAWILSTDRGDHFEPQLFRLLRAIHETGKLTLAVKTIGLSYRHAWDLLARWSDIFGGDLVSMHRGKGATLTKVGEKLLWAEERTEAGLFPQLANIASEVNVEIRRAQKGATPVLRLHASHGYAVQKLPELVRRHGSSVIDLKYMGSAEALASLHRGACDAAGFHLPLGPLGPVMWSDYARWVRPQQQRIIRLVTRTQGLIVAKGNPLGIATLHDLARPRVRFVHRQAGSGTRSLFDALLHASAIDPARIKGVGTGEFTHAAVAAFVASGMADAALGVEPAARQFKLDFLPVVKERYMLICNKATLAKPPLAELIGLLKSREFAGAGPPAAGYELDGPGDVVAVEDLFPWVRGGA